MSARLLPRCRDHVQSRTYCIGAIKHIFNDMPSLRRLCCHFYAALAAAAVCCSRLPLLPSRRWRPVAATDGSTQGDSVEVLKSATDGAHSGDVPTTSARQQQQQRQQRRRTATGGADDSQQPMNAEPQPYPYDSTRWRVRQREWAAGPPRRCATSSVLSAACMCMRAAVYG